MSEQLEFRLGDEPDHAGAPPSPHDKVPVDQDARDRVAHDLDATLFVEAGAGSGKTTALVERIVALVHAGIQLEHIAAITFTEKAAAELRQRVRERLEGEYADTGAASLDTALRQLDAAPISTLHAFAQRILFEHPIEAGLPPGVEVLDELASQVDFDQRWDDFLPALLAEPAMAAPILVGDALGIGPNELRSLAQQFENNWDLVAARVSLSPEPLDVDLTPLLQQLRRVAGAASEALEGEDRLAVLLSDVAAYADRLEAVSDDAAVGAVDSLVDLAELLSAQTPSFGTSGRPYKSKGSKKNWPDEERFEAIKVELFEAGEARDAVRQRLATSVIHVLAAAIAAFVLDAVDERRRAGRLRFHDLLVLAREMLRADDVGPSVHSTLHERYQRLLIDEFQDTDPIQVDLAAIIAAAEHPGNRHWSEIDCSPGRLFFVGDPKQSIYRFRRADIATYLRAQSVFGGDGGQVQLTTNFRSSRSVINWVNRVFSQLIQPIENSQPSYRPLHDVRDRPENGPGVRVLGAVAQEGKPTASELRRLEANDVVGAIVEAINSGWTVAERAPDGTTSHRSAELGDITILLPARTSLPSLEDALESASIPYRAETASLVYATPEVRDLLMIARAVDDPTDELAAVAALRTAAFACGDDDLYTYRQTRGATWNHQMPTDEIEGIPADNPVPRSLAWLAALHRERNWLAPAQVLDRIVRERRFLQLGVCQLRHREVWRRLRFVIDQARAWTDATGGDLRDYLVWVRLQASDSARVAETVLPETDTDAVRIMTVHASKGLEFPITIVSGLTTQHRIQRAGVHVSWPPDGSVGYRLGSANATPEYEAFVPLDEQMDGHERLRLLYVACTRARDHLVVSMHRGAEGSPTTLAAVLAAVDADALAETAPMPTNELAPRSVVQPAARLTPYDAWATERSLAISEARRSHTIAATTLARLAAERHEDPGLDKAARNLDLPPWQKGRYGTAIGRAVHGVLQTVDLESGAGMADLAAAQAAAEGVLGREDTIAALATSALSSAVVREAAALPHWREVFVAAPVADRLVEGYVDLLYRRSDGMVVVDHKTDAWKDDEDLDAKVARYRIQTAAYAVAVEAATGVPVVDAVLLFLDEQAATARHVVDLADAKAEVVELTPTAVGGGEASAVDNL